MGKAIEITRLDRSARELRELAVRIEDWTYPGFVEC
jgi:hypothetical protein